MISTRRHSLFLAFGLLLCLALLTGCGGGGLISKSQEVQMGQQAGDEFEKQHGLETDPAVNSLVNAIAARVTAAAQPPEYPYDVRVLRTREVNAVAFPGGRLYLYRGLIDDFQRDPDMIAWVTAHEAAHVARRHAVKRIERQLGAQAVIALLFNRGDAPQIAGAIAGLMLLDYGRDNEFEADRYGMRYAHAAGYDPTAALAVLLRFRELQGRQPSDLEIMFMTHPGNDDRINHVKSFLREQSWGGQHYAP